MCNVAIFCSSIISSVFAICAFLQTFLSYITTVLINIRGGIRQQFLRYTTTERLRINFCILYSRKCLLYKSPFCRCSNETSPKMFSVPHASKTTVRDNCIEHSERIFCGARKMHSSQNILGKLKPEKSMHIIMNIIININFLTNKPILKDIVYAMTCYIVLSTQGFY